jgi:hypothetical protein
MGPGLVLAVVSVVSHRQALAIDPLGQAHLSLAYTDPGVRRPRRSSDRRHCSPPSAHHLVESSDGLIVGGQLPKRVPKSLPEQAIRRRKSRSRTPVHKVCGPLTRLLMTGMSCSSSSPAITALTVVDGADWTCHFCATFVPGMGPGAKLVEVYARASVDLGHPAALAGRR